MGISIASNPGAQEGFLQGVESTVNTPESDEATETQEEAVTETIGQKNARESAESYLSFTAFSREGLIDQLEFEEYSTEDAEYAVDALNVDWKEQAAKSAESYLEFTSFSREGLIDQLLFEGYTQEEAEYGVTAVGY
jgi:4-alpha-glucanotransferase